jgi:hypothetical protein
LVERAQLKFLVQFEWNYAPVENSVNRSRFHLTEEPDCNKYVIHGASQSDLQVCQPGVGGEAYSLATCPLDCH